MSARASSSAAANSANQRARRAAESSPHKLITRTPRLVKLRLAARVLPRNWRLSELDPNLV
jgi:hypothetical protein